MLWIQMLTASRGSGWSELMGAGVGSMGDAWKVVELFTFDLSLKLFWYFVWLTLTFSFFVTDSPSLLHKPLLPHFPSVMDCVSLKIMLVLGGLWKIYNRWAVFEGYVFSNYLFAKGFGLCGCSAKCSSNPALLFACPVFVACESNWIQITNQ